MIRRFFFFSFLLSHTVYSYSLLLTGDVHFAELYHAAGIEEKMSPTYHSRSQKELLSGLSPFMSASDGVLINLESPITHLETSPFEGQKNYMHKEDPKKIAAFLKAFPIKGLSLANNHTLDFGKQGLLDTLDHLKKIDVPLIGAGINRNQASKPLLLDLPLKSGKIIKLAVFAGFEKRTSYQEKYDYYARNNSPGVIAINDQKILGRIKALKVTDPQRKIIYYPHWGLDYQDVNTNQQRWAQQLLEAGVDLIVGHGSHALQEVGLKQNRLIVFGMGNFAFYTPGLYRRYRSHPYSLVTRMIFTDTTHQIRLYPLITNHRIVKFLPRAVHSDEWEDVKNILKKKMDPSIFKKLKQDQDELGFYFAVNLDENLLVL